MTVRVLLVDDERLVRTGFRMILATEPDIEVVGEAQDGLEAIDASARLHPDVVLMDIRMPRMHGLEAAHLLLDGPDAPRVIVLTTFDLDEYVYEALRAGASGFLLKDAPEDQLIAAIRVAADGGSLFAPSVTRRLVASFASRSPRGPRVVPGLDDLTAREAEVLLLVARGLSNREIADALVISEHTAKTHVAHILGKLGLRDRVQAVVCAYEAGLVRAGDA
jgi:DNA-binding NarL/FixJ family response regulator